MSTMNPSPPVMTKHMPRLRCDLTPPAWVLDLVPGRPRSRSINALKVEVAQAHGASLVSVSLPGAGSLDAGSFEQRTADAYRCIRGQLAELGDFHPARFWNFLPAIHEPMDQRRDRYMVFNAGRFAAFSDWFGGPDHLPSRLPAASGVGHRGDALVIHCLALEQPGQAIENPRQIPAFRYSARYGPLPPCFARATIITDPRDRAPLLLVAGTASIRGEQSVCEGDLSGQLHETFANLLSLIGAAQGPADPPALSAFIDVSVYFVNAHAAQQIEQSLRAAFGTAVRMQLIQADLCWPDLLVEVEGVARLSGRRRA